MARGWTAVEQQTEALAAQREQFDAQRLPMLSPGARNPGPFQIRFLEQGPDVNSFPVHEYKVPNPQMPGGFSFRRFTCLSEVNQDCPGCRAGMKRKQRGVFNILQRQRPVYQKGTDGKLIKDAQQNFITIGYEDTVVIASVGGPTAEMLRKADGQYQGLMSRDFIVQFSGDTFQAWNLTPVLDAQGNAMATPMSDADLALAAQKHNLDEFMKPPDAQEAARIVAQYGGNSGVQTTAPGTPAPSPQGTAGQAGAANGFLAGAAMPPTGGAFGAAQAAIQPPATPVVPPATPAPAPQ